MRGGSARAGAGDADAGGFAVRGVRRPDRTRGASRQGDTQARAGLPGSESDRSGRARDARSADSDRHARRTSTSRSRSRSTARSFARSSWAIASSVTSRPRWRRAISSPGTVLSATSDLRISRVLFTGQPTNGVSALIGRKVIATVRAGARGADRNHADRSDRQGRQYGHADRLRRRRVGRGRRGRAHQRRPGRTWSRSTIRRPTRC